MEFETFKKRVGTTDLGKDYEDLMVAYLGLKLTVNNEVHNFNLWSNAARYGRFDDVILELESMPGDQQKYALQLKHSSSGKQLSREALASPKGNFSIQTYFNDFMSLRRNNETLSEKTKLILFTNLSFHHNTERDLIKLEMENVDIKIVKHELLGEFDYGFCYKFEILTGEDRSRETMNHYKDFFKCFYLYTNQQNVDQLKTNILETFRYRFCCNNDFGERYLTFIRQWSQQTENIIKLNLEFMKRAISMILLTPFVKPYSFCPYTDNEKSRLLKQAICSFNLTLVEERTFDKVEQIWGNFDISLLEDSSRLRRIARYYFLNSEELDNKTKSILLWLMNDRPLIVTTNKTTYEATNLWENGHFIILGLAAEQDDYYLKIFQNLGDLPEESIIYKNIVKAFRCSIQGKNPIPLQTLIEMNYNFRNVFTVDELVQMVDDSFKIGKNETLSTIYIDRFLTKNIINFEFLNNAKQDTVIIISCMQKFDNIKNHFIHFNVLKIKEYLRNTVSDANTISEHDNKTKIDIYVDENLCSSQEFDKICKKNAEKNRFHHLRVEDNGMLEWVHSRGSVEEVQIYRSSNYFIRDVELLDYATDNNITIISGDPGVGKSTLLRKIKNIYLPTFWTAFIDAKDFRGDILNFLVAELTEVEKKLVVDFMEAKQIAVFWDGLDQLSSQKLELVLKAIDKLAARGFKQWITASKNLERSLAYRFNVLPRIIKPFEVEQQKIYIEQSLGDDPHKTQTVINYINAIKYKDMFGIPSQLSLLTELAVKNWETWQYLLNDTLYSTARLYKYFVDEKFNVHLQDKLNWRDLKPRAKQEIEKLKNDYVKYFEKAAVLSIFDDEILQELNVNKVLKNEQNYHSIGIITGSAGGKPQFVYPSFAEYFAAKYLQRNCNKISEIVKKVIFQKKYDNVRLMLDFLWAEDSEPHLAVLCKNLNYLRNCHNCQCKDDAGRNPLQLVCSWGSRFPLLKKHQNGNKYTIEDGGNLATEDDLEYRQMLEILLKECDPTEKDKFFQMDSFDYADKSLCLLPIVMMLSSTEQEFDFSRFENFSDLVSVAYYSVKFDYDILLDKIPRIPTIETSQQASLLCVSVANNSTKCFKKLLLSNKNPKNVINQPQHKNGETLIHVACRNNNYEILETLIAFKASINAVDKNKCTPLITACQYGNYEVVDLLIKSKAKINCHDKRRNTAINAASAKGSLEIVRLLVESGSKINTSNKDGDTPLHEACTNGHTDIAQLLINQKCKIHVMNKRGHTPLDVAKREGLGDIVALLEQLLIITPPRQTTWNRMRSFFRRPVQ